MLVVRLAMLSPIALLAGALFMPGAATAQCRLCDAATTVVEPEGDSTPIKLDIQARLDFDQLILRDTSSGMARLSLDERDPSGDSRAMPDEVSRRINWSKSSRA